MSGSHPSRKKLAGYLTHTTMKITKEQTLGEVVLKHPETIETFFKFGLHCIGCGMARLETIEQGCMAHGIDPDKLVKELNNAIKNAKK